MEKTINFSLMGVKIGVVGLGTAGITFISELKRYKKKNSIEIVAFEERGPKIFHPCSIPEAVEGRVEPEKLLEPLPFKDIRVEGKAVEIEPISKTIQYIKNDGKTEKEKFDFIFVATGGETPLPKSEKSLKSTKYEDVLEIKRRLEKSRKVAVVGSGILGLEMASAISKHTQVEIFEMGQKILPNFLSDTLSDFLYQKITETNKKVSFNFGTKVDNPDELDSDFVLFCVGFKPNTISLHKIYVDDFMRLKHEDGKGVYQDVFSAGDCVEDKNIPYVAPRAAEQARIAAKNILAIINGNEPQEKYQKIISPCILKAFGFEIGKVGKIQEKESGKEQNTLSFTLDIKIMPFSEDRMKVFLKVDNDGNIIEAQAISNFRSEVRHFLDIFYICIKKGIKIDELRRFELSYQPEICKFPDPITSIAEVISRRLERL